MEAHLVIDEKKLLDRMQLDVLDTSLYHLWGNVTWLLQVETRQVQIHTQRISPFVETEKFPDILTPLPTAAVGLRQYLQII